MVEPYNILTGSQTDINRRLLRKIEELEEEAHVNSTVYSFKSYDSEGDQIGTGTVHTTGIRIGNYIQMEVLTNSVEGFVGQKFYVIKTAKPDGKTRYTLYSDAGNTSTGMKVTITE